MRIKVFECLRLPRFCKIFRSCDQNLADDAAPDSHQAGLLQVTNPDAYIHALINEVDDTINIQGSGLKLWILVEEFCQQRCYEHSAKQYRRGDIKQPFGFRIRSYSRSFGRLQVKENAFGVFQKPAAAIRQHDRSRGADKQTNAKLLLQHCDCSRHGRRRHVEITRRHSKSAKIGNLGKDLNGVKLVDDYYSITLNNIFIIFVILQFKVTTYFRPEVVGHPNKGGNHNVTSLCRN